MRIFEITDKNNNWSILTGISTEFNTEYNFIIKIVNTIAPMRSRRMNQMTLINIAELEQKLVQFLNTQFPDKLDSDIIQLKSTSATMLAHLAKLKQQLTN